MLLASGEGRAFNLVFVPQRAEGWRGSRGSSLAYRYGESEQMTLGIMKRKTLFVQDLHII
jgi:hypothetical protein